MLVNKIGKIAPTDKNSRNERKALLPFSAQSFTPYIFANKLVNL
jgi:hypothetical protein